MRRFPVTALRSVDIGTPDVALSERFYTLTWGLDVVARNEGAVYLRASGTDHHVLALHCSDRPEILSVTFRTASADDLPMIADNVVQHGAQILSGPCPNEDPDGGTILTIREPQGGILRFVHGDRQHPTGEEVTNRPFRLAHVNLNSTDVDTEVAFYEKALGFRLTDRSKMMAFLRCNSDHHAVVLAEAKVNGLNHIAFLVPDWESVMRAMGQVTTSSPTSSTLLVSWSSTRPKLFRSTKRTGCVARTNGSGHPAAPISGALLRRKPNM
jgi:catechol 2,3-dioxygenase